MVNSTSNARFASELARLYCGLATSSMAIPATARLCRRSSATSIRPGETIRSTPRASTPT